ncbi:MAG: hypothetical protein ABI144_11280, partial [Gallionella sp.]
FLDAYAGNYEYRTQIATWWWTSWRTSILSCLAVFATVLGAWFWWVMSRNRKQQHEQSLAIEHEQRMEQNRILNERHAQARLAAERQSRMEWEAVKAEQERLAKIEAAEELVEMERNRLEAEQAEAAELMDAIFNQASRGET